MAYGKRCTHLTLDAGFLIHAPDNVIREFPQFPVRDEFDELLASFRDLSPRF